MQPPSPVSLVVLFAVLAVGVGWLERRARLTPLVPFWRRERRLDIVYWFFTPYAGQIASGAAFALTLGLAFAVTRGRIADLADFLRAHGPIVAQPRALQILEGLLFADLITYWVHRASHRGWLWRIHALHHSTESLDWLSAARVHPLNEALNRVVLAVPLLALGFEPGHFAALAPVLGLHGLFLHASVGWDFGPLRLVIASPCFHRWHHARDVQGVNFAGLFPVWDLIFGTLHLPRHQQPTRFGIDGPPPPPGLFAQLAWPFRWPHAVEVRAELAGGRP